MKNVKKIALLLLVILILSITSVFAYHFPEPDWGGLLNERKSMVTKNELELYIESVTNSAPYFGAKFEPMRGTYLGMTADTAEDFRPLGSYLTYMDGIEQEDLYYPSNFMIERDTVIPTVAINVSSIDNIDFDVVRRTLNRLDSYNMPMFVRFANEMNCSELGDEPDNYVSVFRSFANMVHEYPNFAMVWSPNDIGALDRPFQYYYPGDEYVDWVGVSCYMKKYFMDNHNNKYDDTIFFMTGDFAWATNKVKPVIDYMKKYNINKPLMVSEGGAATNSSRGDEYEEWAAPRLRNMLNYLVMRYPQIKLINYFNVIIPYEVEKYNISGKTYAEDIYKEASQNGAYIREFGMQSDFSFNTANSAETLKAKDGIVNLYTYAYLPGYPEVTINYSIDDVWYSFSQKIPYKCSLNLNDITDGQHTLTISTVNNNTKKYTFFKRGDCICFGQEPDSSLVTPDPVTPPAEPVHPIAPTEIRVILNGNNIDFGDQPPVIINGRTLVPLRAIFEALGAEVTWEADTQTVTASRNGIKIFLRIGSDKMYINNVEKILDVEAQLINSKTMVPLRAISESFGCDVSWNDSERTVTLVEQ